MSSRSPLPRILRWGAPLALVALIAAGVWSVVFRDEPLPDETWWHEIPPPTVPRAGENPWQPLLDRWPTEEAMLLDLSVTRDDLRWGTWSTALSGTRDRTSRTLPEKATVLRVARQVPELEVARDRADRFFAELDARETLWLRRGSSRPATLDGDPGIALHWLCGWICAYSWEKGETETLSRAVRIDLLYQLDRVTSEVPIQGPSDSTVEGLRHLQFALELFEDCCSLGLLDTELDKWAARLAALPSGERLWDLQVRESFRVARNAMTDPEARRRLFDLWSKDGVAPHLPSAMAAKRDPLRLKPHRALRRAGDYLRECLGSSRRPTGNLPSREQSSRAVRVAIDPFGDVLVEHLVDGLPLVWKELELYEEGRDASEILVAIRRYRRDHGALPPSLDALVPVYVASVPIDPIVGGPWQYDSDRGLFWCGPDQRDELGIDGPWYWPHLRAHEAVRDRAEEVRER